MGQENIFVSIERSGRRIRGQMVDLRPGFKVIYIYSIEAFLTNLINFPKT